MDLKNTNRVLFIIIFFAISLSLAIMCVLCVSFYNESQGKYIEIWAKDYAPLISALGILIASALASVSVQRTIEHNIKIEDDKILTEIKRTNSNNMTFLVGLSSFLKEFNDLLGSKFYNNSTQLSGDALVIFNEINDFVSQQLSLIAVMDTPNIDEPQLSNYMGVVFVVTMNLRKIKIATKLGIEQKSIPNSDLNELKDFIKTTTTKIDNLGAKSL